MAVIVDSAKRFESETEVLVIGAGACGLVAALALRDAGRECVVLERDPVPAGSTALSSGLIPACDTRWQRDMGVADSVERLLADVMAKNGHRADAAVARAVCAASGPALEWLADRHGVPFHVQEGFLYPGHSVARMHAVPEKTGAALIGRLTRAAAAAGVDLLCGARVTDLYATGDRRVGGMRLTRPDGSTEEIGCAALILACNGYGGNPEMVRRYIPEIADAEYAGHTGNQGDAVRWGEALGAQIADMGAYQGHGSLATPQRILITWALMMEGGFQVNARGERFWNEHEGYSEAAVHVLAQPGRFAWNVYDERLHRLGLDFPDYVEADKLGAIKRAGSAASLAAAIGVPRAALEATLASVADACAGRRKDAFRRGFSGKPALAPPYRAVKVTGALFHTQGGLAVDAGARVLDAGGKPLPNLFAGGGAARGISGSTVEGYLSGNGLLTAVTLGRLAAASAVRLLAGRS
jgi:fumarate reductase flavoprotein subunit